MPLSSVNVIDKISEEYYDLTTPIRDYDIDFIEGCLIEAWPEVNKLAQTKINDLPF